MIASFSAHRSIWSYSKRSIYTEADLVVTYVAEGSADLAAGSTVNLDLPGGTISTTDGKLLSFLTDPGAYSIQPTVKYLFVLVH